MCKEATRTHPVNCEPSTVNFQLYTFFITNELRFTVIEPRSTILKTLVGQSPDEGSPVINLLTVNPQLYCINVTTPIIFPTLIYFN